NGAFARPRIAAHGHHQRGLAGAIGADQCDDLSVVDIEIDTFERHDATIKGLHAAHGEEGSTHSPTSASTLATSLSATPRYAAIISGSSRPCAGGPSAIFTP